MPSAHPEKRTEERTETHACDCISRQAAIEAVYKCADIFVGDMPVMVVKADAYEALAQLQSAQPKVLACGEGELIAQPEIVRCKDCKHRYVDGDNVRYNACELNHNNVQSDDWFCADGERRENNESN